ncbi:O-succinylbenzoic acid--CoA ligase [Maribacter hydrothermalis]|uniref:O-succinylbenzoic acid--CoA ligase n=2 Tax=Maribacter hydrothermalis TaxID=1836467 RepID=A0A1B7ZCN9_9FLAO|nr:O-succinylbenzoic acid--CoA ligase [Maribacter hydrothermalis]OBR40897.1 O-succinylbenzoic acid--CoA ligase [Maribacter hydrothermalis]
MDRPEIHPYFSIHGRKLSFDDLVELSYSFIKEGDDFEKHIGEFILDWIDDSPIISVQTSGSTGAPKIVSIKKEQMVQSALATGEYFNLTPKKSVLLCLSAEFIAGKMMIVRALVLGLDLHLLSPTSSPLQSVKRTFSFGAMVPLQVENSLSKLGQIETLIIGGAPISIALKEKLKDIGNTSYETYGMTETLTHIAVKPLNYGVSDQTPFSILPGIEISIDERGCLVINAPKISDNPVITNDLVDLVSKTEFKWLGRFDNIINSGGVKLRPEQIEDKLSNVIDQSFFIGSLPDPKLGEQLVLIIEGKADPESLMQDIVASTLLSKYEIPKQIKILPVFLRTNSDKIKRKETMDLLKA